MRQTIQNGSSESLRAENLGPLLKRKIRRDDHARSFIGRRDYVEQQFATELARRDVAQLVEDQQVQLRKLILHSH